MAEEARLTFFGLSIGDRPVELSMESTKAFLEDLFLSSDGTVILTIVMLIALVLFRVFVSDDELQEQFEERMQEEALADKWKQHNKRWNTNEKVPPKQGIITSKPLPPTTTQVVATDPLPTKVTIVGDLESAVTVLVTYHDIGLNHRLCFGRLVQWLNSANMLVRVAVVHIDAPGHEDGAAALGEVDPAVMNLERLAQHVKQIIAKLNITRFVGVGAGAGANVLLRYVSENPGVARGLILQNPTLHGPSYTERISLSVVRSLMSPIRFRKTANTQLAKLHYSGRAMACTAVPRSYLKMYKNTAEWDNKMWFIDTYRNRDAFDSDRIDRLQSTPLLLFSSKDSEGLELISHEYPLRDVEEMVLTLLEHSTQHHVSHCRIRGCGQQLTEERPEELIGPMKSFISNLGMQLGEL